MNDTTKPALPEPVAWRDPSNINPGQSVTFERSKHERWPHIYSEPLYTRAAIEAAVAEARAETEWPCACDEQGRGEPGVTCGDCPRDYGHCVTPSPTPVEQPKPMARVREALDLNGPHEPTPTTAESYARALPVPPGQRDPVPSDVWLARVPKPAERVALSDEAIRNLWHKTFSTSNPFCPCDLGPFTKAVRAAEYAHGITPAQGEQP